MRTHSDSPMLGTKVSNCFLLVQITHPCRKIGSFWLISINHDYNSFNQVDYNLVVINYYNQPTLDRTLSLYIHSFRHWPDYWILPFNGQAPLPFKDRKCQKPWTFQELRRYRITEACWNNQELVLTIILDCYLHQHQFHRQRLMHPLPTYVKEIITNQRCQIGLAQNVVNQISYLHPQIVTSIFVFKSANCLFGIEVYWSLWNWMNASVSFWIMKVRSIFKLFVQK